MVLHALAAASVFVVNCIVVEAVAPHNQGYRSAEKWIPRVPVVTSATGEELIADAASLPMHWDWRDVNGQSLVVADVMQHLPKYCGSCWIHGTVAALNDRIKMSRRGAFPDVMISRQALINCVPQADTGELPGPGCDGGDPWQIYKYMHHNRVPDETCMPYEATNLACDGMCTNTAAGFMVKQGWGPQKRWKVPGWLGYTIGDYGNVTGERAMMKEIYARGPISCNIACDGKFLLNYSEVAAMHEGVYVDDFQSNETDHVVEVTGWGETPSGLKYWVIRNSWGTFWGDRGWFKLRRGVNQMLIEGSCSWAVPKFDDLDRAIRGETVGDYVRGYHPAPAAFKNTALGASMQTNQVRWYSPPPGSNSHTLLVAIIAGSLGACLTYSVQFLTSKRHRIEQRGLLG